MGVATVWAIFSQIHQGANPSIVSYNGSAGKITTLHTSSLVLLKTKNILL
jgi:hypothetical protein